MEHLKDLKQIIIQLEVDLVKFYDKDNRTASIRARKVLQQIKKQAQIIRDDIIKIREKRD